MEITKHSLITITEPDDAITINGHLEKTLRDNIVPILWSRNGMFYLIPIEVLMNVSDEIETQKKLNQAITKNKLQWGVGLRIPHDIGVTLQGGKAIDDQELHEVKYVGREKRKPLWHKNS